MQAVLLLFAAAWLTHQGSRSPWCIPLAIIAAAWAGTTLPDLDLPLGFGHRSALTHSVLPIAIASARRSWRPLAAGLALGIGLHLSADLFPNAMRGFATIKLPGIGALRPLASYWWIAFNGAVALAVGVALTLQLAPIRVAAAILTLIGVLGALYLFRTDGGWAALALFGAGGWLAVRAHRRLAD